MNAQLRELLREARCPSAAYGKHPDQCVWCEARAAALAAPKEAGAEPLSESPYFPDVESVVRYMDDLANAVNAITGDEGEDDPLTVLQRYAANPLVDQRQEGEWLKGDGAIAWRFIDGDHTSLWSSPEEKMGDERTLDIAIENGFQIEYAYPRPATPEGKCDHRWSVPGPGKESTCVRCCASPPPEAAAAVGDVALREALSSIYQYGADTLSGRADGPDDRKWQRDAVLEMTRRAEAALAAPTGPQPAGGGVDDLLDALLQRPNRVWQFPGYTTTELARGIVVDPIELRALVKGDSHAG